MGEGVGLEIANSFFVFSDREMNTLAYLGDRHSNRETMRKLIEAGYIDCIHSWGNGFEDRDSAIAAVDELKRDKLKLEVWTNHAENRSNFGNWKPGYGPGDNEDSKYYHADLTIAYGIRYVWLGSCTWILGQATPVRITTFLGSFDSRHPAKSLMNLAKAVSKHVLSSYGLLQNRYAMHFSNDLVEPVVLDDGQKVYQFQRYDNHYDGIGRGANARAMHYNLSERVIQQLVSSSGYAILYTHFAYNDGCGQLICKETQKALRFLEKEYRKGEIYVTTTAKLLRYHVNHKYLKWHYEAAGNYVAIRVSSVDDPVFGEFIPDLRRSTGHHVLRACRQECQNVHCRRGGSSSCKESG